MKLITVSQIIINIETEGIKCGDCKLRTSAQCLVFNKELEYCTDFNGSYYRCDECMKAEVKP